MPELLAPARWGPTAEGWFARDDLAIAVDPLDPSRYVVSRLSTGQHQFAGRIPPSASAPDDLVWFGSVLAYDAAEATDGTLTVPTAQGLGPWLDAAQVAVDDLIEADAREREEWQRSLLGRTAEELLREVAEDVSWILPGILPRGFNLAVAGREKIGKGTWIYSQLGAAERSGMSAYIVSEEPPESTREKAHAFGLRRSRIVYGWELKAKARSWKERVPRIVKEAALDGHTFVFLDNVSRSAGIEDESGVELARAVEILQDACREAGLIFLGDFHHKKGRGSIEDKFRGGTAVPGSFDVIVDVERVGGRDSRKRKLTSRGRLRVTMWQRVVELNAEGTAYTDVADPGDTPQTLGEMLERGERATGGDLAMKDRMMLIALGPTTAESFAERIERSVSTARKRLNALVEEGFARKIKGGISAEGRVADTWEAVEPSRTADS